MREDGSGLPFLPFDLRIGQDVRILGKQIKICDCDDYTREFFKVQKKPQGPKQEIP